MPFTSTIGVPASAEPLTRSARLAITSSILRGVVPSVASDCLSTGSCAFAFRAFSMSETLARKPDGWAGRVFQVAYPLKRGGIVQPDPGLCGQRNQISPLGPIHGQNWHAQHNLRRPGCGFGVGVSGSGVGVSSSGMVISGGSRLGKPPRSARPRWWRWAGQFQAPGVLPGLGWRRGKARPPSRAGAPGQNQKATSPTPPAEPG